MTIMWASILSDNQVRMKKTLMKKTMSPIRVEMRRQKVVQKRMRILQNPQPNELGLKLKMMESFIPEKTLKEKILNDNLVPVNL